MFISFIVNSDCLFVAKSDFRENLLNKLSRLFSDTHKCKNFINAHRFFYITQSDITIFYYIFNFIKMFLKSSFLTFQNGRFLHVRLQTHYFSFSFMIFHFIIRILHVQIIFLHRRRRPP